MQVAWEHIAPMVVGVVFIVTTAATLILRPLAKRMADLLEVYTQQKDSSLVREVGQLRDVVETLNSRLQLVEERQDFTDRLLQSGEKRETPTRE
ncbi:MAG: hypothetical protein OEZ65_13595 [Gemmatimonadota bacterium]|nr:hypothetical protein [Gemmatimonadota bacterium]